MIEIFKASPCPPLLARQVLILILGEWHACRDEYRLHLEGLHLFAVTSRFPGMTELLNQEMDELALFEQIPSRSHLDGLFRHEGFERFGVGLFPVWTAMLILLVELGDRWERAVLGLPPRNPHLLPGFHADERVLSTAWLEEFRHLWREEVSDVHCPNEKGPRAEIFV